MLDTVVLTIPANRFRVQNPERFSPPSSILWQPGNYLIRCVNNPTAQDKKDGWYKPRLTLIKRPGKVPFDIPLRIEFSAPKLLFLNNIDELEETDFETVLKTLKVRMREMGVDVPLEILRTAPVSVFHASKNIILKDGYTASFAINELQKISLSRRLDMNKADFRNEGQALQYYTNSYAFVAYDKMRDITKPKNRAIDKDKTGYQLSLFEQIKQRSATPEILRIEVRMTKKPKMLSVLDKLEFNKAATFENIFNKMLCQQMITYCWKEFLGNNTLFLFDMSSGPQQIFREIVENAPGITTKEAIYLLGLKVLCRDTGGIRQFRRLLEEYFSDRTWYRLAKNLKRLNSFSRIENTHGWYRQIQEDLRSFKSVKASSL